MKEDLTKIDSMERRVESIGGEDWVPLWLADVASEAEVEEWKAINKKFKGFDRDAPMTAFIQRMRAKYPNMAKGYEEQVAEEVAKLKADPELRKREGLTEEDEEENK